MKTGVPQRSSRPARLALVTLVLLAGVGCAHAAAQLKPQILVVDPDKSWKIQIAGDNATWKASCDKFVVLMKGPIDAKTRLPAANSASYSVGSLGTKNLHDGILYATLADKPAPGEYVFVVQSIKQDNRKGFTDAVVSEESTVPFQYPKPPPTTPIDITNGVILTPDPVTKDILIKSLAYFELKTPANDKPLARIRKGVITAEKHPELTLVDGGKNLKATEEVKAIGAKKYFCEKYLSGGAVLLAKGNPKDYLGDNGNIVVANGTAADFTVSKLRKLIADFGTTTNKAQGKIVAAAGCNPEGHVIVLEPVTPNAALPPIEDVKTVAEVAARLKASYLFR